MSATTMLEQLEKVSDKVKGYWEKNEKGEYFIQKLNKRPYADIIKDLMEKAVL